MTPAAEVLYFHLLDGPLVDYYRETDYAQCLRRQEALTYRLRRALPPEQQDLLAEVLEACSDTESCELEAMFLAAMDLTLSLLCRPHFRRMAEK